MNINELIGEEIRKARISKDFTQGGLADKVGVDRTAVCRWENGERQISLDQLIKVLNVCGRSAASTLRRIIEKID